MLEFVSRDSVLNAEMPMLLEDDKVDGIVVVGSMGKEYLEKLIWGEAVTVRYTENDRYGRILGEIWHGKMLVNEEMVKEGWAWIYKNFSASRKLVSLERDARKAQKGIWSDPNPISPWEWRAAKRKEKSKGKNTGEIPY